MAASSVSGHVRDEAHGQVRPCSPGTRPRSDVLALELDLSVASGWGVLPQAAPAITMRLVALAIAVGSGTAGMTLVMRNLAA